MVFLIPNALGNNKILLKMSEMCAGAKESSITDAKWLDRIS
jgi:hypothetical protein